MPRARHAVWALLTLLVLVLTAGPARAAVRVAASGWLESAEAAPDARRRASRWTDALGGLRMVQVLSTNDNRFAETIAVFERAEPIPARAFATPEQALASLTELVRELVGTEPPIAGELRTLPSGAQIVWAQWIVDDLAYEFVLAPSGDSASLIVVAVLAGRLPTMRAELDAIYASLEGVTAPMPAFSLPAWRFGSLGVWVALAIGLHLLMLVFVDRDRDHRQAGFRAAATLLPVIVVGTLIARAALVERELALIHAGTSTTGLLTWIGVSGLCVVALLVLIAQRADRGVVQSAPASGAFASGTYSTADMVRSTIQKAAIRDPSSSSGTWARTRRPGHDMTEPSIGPDESVSSGHRIIVDDAERLPPAP